jgi:hypothetical protein
MQRKLVWDLPLRLFHWSLVLLFLASWLTAEIGLHGPAFLLRLRHRNLVLFRLAWGLVGPRYARFKSFLAGPRRVTRLPARLVSRCAIGPAGPHAAGRLDDPGAAGPARVQVATGMVNSHDGLDAGPWYWAASRSCAPSPRPGTRAGSTCCWCSRSCTSLQYCCTGCKPGIDLVGPMFTGRKRTAEPAIPGSRLPLAACLLLAAAAWSGASCARRPPPSLADLGIY